MLKTEHAPGPRHTRLNFIPDQHDVMGVADAAQRCQKLGRSYVKPALALYRLNDDRGNTAGIGG